MIELIVLFFLCKGNRDNAIERGKSGGAAIAYTLGLWVGLEIIGAIIGFIIGLELVAYILAIVFAGMGGVISWMIAKNGQPIIANNEQPLNEQSLIENTEGLGSNYLSALCKVLLVWDDGNSRDAGKLTFKMNGNVIGQLERGQSITVKTGYRNNTINVKKEDSPIQYRFVAVDGKTVEIHFNGHRFLIDQTRVYDEMLDSNSQPV